MMNFGIDKPTGKLKHRMIDKFLSELGVEYDLIMTYCLGRNWRIQKVDGSHIKFNQKLGTDLKESDNVIESGQKIKKAWYSIKRDNLLDEILS